MSFWETAQSADKLNLFVSPVRDQPVCYLALMAATCHGMNRLAKQFFVHIISLCNSAPSDHSRERESVRERFLAEGAKFSRAPREIVFRALLSTARKINRCVCLRVLASFWRHVLDSRDRVEDPDNNLNRLQPETRLWLISQSD